MGVPLPVEAIVIKDFMQAPADHTPKQAKSLEPEQFWNLVAMVKQDSKPTTTSSRLLLLAAISCIRCKHLAGSRLTSACDEMVAAFCLKGKRVQKGARPPYSWAVPIVSFLDKKTFGFLTEMLTRWHFPRTLSQHLERAPQDGSSSPASGFSSLWATTNGCDCCRSWEQH